MTEYSTEVSEHQPPSRRTVLRGASAGVLGVSTAGLLAAAACGTDDPGPDTTVSAGTSPASLAAGTVVGPTSDVPVNGGKVYPDLEVVVTQPTEGTFKAFTSICTHQGCQVDGVADDEITCPCHGSVYSAEDGSVLNGPATVALAAKTVTVTDGQLVVS